MTIPAFPTSLPAPRATMAGSTSLPQYKDESEAAYIYTRKRVTKAREKLTSFGWEYLTEAQYQTLRTFFLQVQGGSFTWPHPITGVTHTLISAADELAYEHIPGGGRSVEWPLEEP